MSVTNGQLANQTTFNNAFMSRTGDTDTSGSITVGGNVKKSVQDGLTAFAGGGQGSATQITNDIAVFTTVSTAGDSAKLPASAVGLQITIINEGASALNVFPSSGQQIDGLGLNVAVAVPADASSVFACRAPGEWVSQVSGVNAVLLNDIESVTANRALQSSASGKIEASAVSIIELGYVAGVTSAIQSQLNALVSGRATTELDNLGTTDLQGVALNGVGEISSTGVAAGDRPKGTITDYNYGVELNSDAGVTGVDPYIGFRRDSGDGAAQAWIGLYSGTFDIGAPNDSGVSVQVKAANNTITGNGSDINLLSGDGAGDGSGGNINITSGNGGNGQGGIGLSAAYVTVNGAKIQSVGAPTDGNDAATKNYADGLANEIFPRRTNAPTKTVIFKEFMDMSGIEVVSGTAVNAWNGPSLIGRPGVMSVTTTGVGTSSARIPGYARIGSNNTYYQTSLFLSTLATVADNYIVRVGVGADTTSATPITSADWLYGIYFEYDKDVFGGNLQLKTANNGTRTSTDTGIAADQVLRVGFTVNGNGSTVDAVIVDLNKVSYVIPTVSTNTPGTVPMNMYYIVDRLTSSASAERGIFVDYTYLDTEIGSLVLR